MRRISWLAISLLIATACGRGPSSPTDLGVGVQLPDGRYMLQITPPVAFQGCTPVPDPPIGIGQVSNVVLTRESDAWVARSATALDGDVELRFRAAAAGATSVLLAGTIQGTAITRVGSGALSASLSGSGTPAAQVTASWSGTSGSVIGKISGAIVFAVDGQTRSTCPTADWVLASSLF